MKSIHIHNSEPNNGNKDHQQVHAKKKKKEKKRQAKYQRVNLAVKKRVIFSLIIGI